VTGKRHRHALWNLPANHVPHCRPPQVVRDAARATSASTRRGPRFGKGANLTRLLWSAPLDRNHAEEDPRNDLAAESQFLMFEVARFEKRPQLVRHEEDAPVAILRCLWIEPDFSCFEIDLAPLKREHLRGKSPPVMYANSITGCRASGKWARTP